MTSKLARKIAELRHIIGRELKGSAMLADGRRKSKKYHSRKHHMKAGDLYYDDYTDKPLPLAGGRRKSKKHTKKQSSCGSALRRHHSRHMTKRHSRRGSAMLAGDLYYDDYTNGPLPLAGSALRRRHSRRMSKHHSRRGSAMLAGAKHCYRREINDAGRVVYVKSPTNKALRKNALNRNLGQEGKIRLKKLHAFAKKYIRKHPHKTYREALQHAGKKYREKAKVAEFDD